MIVRKLVLRNWRNYESLELELSEGLNLIVGDNGSGKTNIAEAIYMMSLGRSWRTDSQAALIRMGESSASITASIEEGDLRREASITLSEGGKTVEINGKPTRRLSELSKLTNVVLFTPESCLIFTGSPSERRNFLDVSIGKADERYFNALSSYSKLLAERNALLKEENIDLDHLRAIDGVMAGPAATITRLRARYIERLSEAMKPLMRKLFGEECQVSIAYKPFLSGKEPSEEEALGAFESSIRTDILRKATQTGPHREDFSLCLDGKDISLYGSQGQNRLAAIALRIAPYFLVEEEGKKPIAILDDVYSELDDPHSAKLGELLQEMGQVVVTSATPINGEASYIEVSDNTAVRRK